MLFCFDCGYIQFIEKFQGIVYNCSFGQDWKTHCVISLGDPGKDEDKGDGEVEHPLGLCGVRRGARWGGSQTASVTPSLPPCPRFSTLTQKQPPAQSWKKIPLTLAGPASVSGEVITTLYEYYCPLFFSLLKYPISQLRTLFWKAPFPPGARKTSTTNALTEYDWAILKEHVSVMCVMCIARERCGTYPTGIWPALLFPTIWSSADYYSHSVYMWDHIFCQKLEWEGENIEIAPKQSSHFFFFTKWKYNL